jgi:hypothetical protein
MVRIPTHAPPTHPGEILLRDLYEITHSPSVKGIRKIKHLIPTVMASNSAQYGVRSGPTERKSRRIA